MSATLQINNMKKRLGLKKYIKSKKDYSYSLTFGAVGPTYLPAEYFYDNNEMPLELPGEYNCTGRAVADICEDEDGRLYSWDYNYAKTLQIKGLPPSTTGVDLKTALSVPLTFGLLPRELEPVNSTKNSPIIAADYKNFPEALDKVAEQYKKPAYFFADGPFDAFDNVRSMLWLNRQNKMSVAIGTAWYQEFEQVGPDGILPAGRYSYGGHAYACKGWKVINGQTYLILKTWQGPSYGDRGYCYMSRDQFNRLINGGGSAMTISPVKPTDVKTIQMSLKQRLLAFMQLLLAQLQQSLFPPQQ